VYPSQVPTQGITGVTAEDVALAEAAGKKIKLLGRAVRQEDGKVVAYVAPHLLPEDHQLAGVEDVFNGIVVCGNVIGDVMFYGRGAGKLPTASAVSADVLDAVKHKNRRQNMDWLPGGEDVVGDYTQLPQRWYIRTEEREMRIGTVFGDVEMVTVPTLPGQTALFTGELTRQQLEEKLQGFEALTCLPVLA
jgi:homoserine dehydrogenase